MHPTDQSLIDDHKTIGSSLKSDVVRARLVQEVQQGRYAGVPVLPGERDLAVALGVSRTTIRRALADLVRSGFLGQRQGYGTFVTRPISAPAERGSVERLGYLRGPGDELLASDQASGIALDSAALSSARPDEAMALDLSAGTRIWRAGRTLLDRQGKALAIERTVIEEAALGSELSDPSAWMAALARNGSQVERSRRRMRMATRDEVETSLPSPEGRTSGIFIEQRGFSGDGRARIAWFMVQTLASFDIVFDVLPVG